MKRKESCLLQTTALEEKIKKLSADYIYEQAVGSLMLMLMSAMEDVEKGDSPLPYTIHEDLLAIKKDIRSYLLSLEDLLEGDQEARTAALETCMAKKEELLSIYETVYSYFSQWNLYSTLVSDQVALRKYKEEGIEVEKIDWSLFFADCHAFMESGNNLLEQKNYMGQILKCLPLHMARDKYYDTITQSLEAAFAGESKAFIEKSLRAFEGFCCPETNPLYGKYFGEVATWMGEKRLMLPHKMEDEELSNLYEDLKVVLESLQDVEEYFSCMLHDLNSLILLFYLTYSFTDLTESNPTFSDLYHTVCEFLTGELDETEREAYLDTLNEQLEQAVEPVIDKANAIGKEEYELLQKVDTFANFTEDTQKILMTEDFIRECFFGDLNDELFQFHLPEDLPVATEEEKKALFADFIQKTRSSLETLPVQTRKIAMQTLMGALPPVYNVSEVMEMVTNAIDSASSLEQKALIVDKVGMVFQDNHYQSITDHAHEHHHDHDCGCGHDHHEHHHHDHGCDCGHDHHEHHHDHDCGCGHDYHHDHH